MNTRPLIIYHGNCADGFTAAWVAHTYFNGACDLHAGTYQDPPPDVTDRCVLLLDFSYKRPVLLEMAQRATGILVLDHHASAISDLHEEEGKIADFSAMAFYTGTWATFCGLVHPAHREGLPNVYTLFAASRSGAGIAWDFFYTSLPRPMLVSYVEDRDLWRFEMEGSREFSAAVFSYGYSMDNWNALAAKPLAEMLREGAAIERKHQKDIKELVGVLSRSMMLGGHAVRVANLPYTYTSDAGLLLAEGRPFGACYWDTPKGRVFSLRSTESGIDVSQIAMRYGGGGHVHAAGFRVTFEEAALMESTYTMEEE